MFHRQGSDDDRNDRTTPRFAFSDGDRMRTVRTIVNVGRMLDQTLLQCPLETQQQTQQQVSRLDATVSRPVSDTSRAPVRAPQT